MNMGKHPRGNRFQRNLDHRILWGAALRLGTVKSHPHTHPKTSSITTLCIEVPTKNAVMKPLRDHLGSQPALFRPSGNPAPKPIIGFVRNSLLTRAIGENACVYFLCGETRNVSSSGGSPCNKLQQDQEHPRLREKRGSP